MVGRACGVTLGEVGYCDAGRLRGARARNYYLTWRDALRIVCVGRLHSVTIALLDSELDDEYAETMRHATAPRADLSRASCYC